MRARLLIYPLKSKVFKGFIPVEAIFSKFLSLANNVFKGTFPVGTIFLKARRRFSNALST